MSRPPRPSRFFIRPPRPARYPLSLHDALPILVARVGQLEGFLVVALGQLREPLRLEADPGLVERLELQARRGSGLLKLGDGLVRSEEHTSELQSREKLVCRLLLEKKKRNTPAP